MNLGFPIWVGVVCEDLESQRRFYEDVLGMRADRDGDGFVAYELEPGGEFELIQRSTEPEYDGVRYQVGFAVDDIEATRDELIARGVTPISEINGSKGEGRWACFKDPEGNVFELKERAAGWSARTLAPTVAARLQARALTGRRARWASGISPIDEKSIGATVQHVNKERASVLAVVAMLLLLGVCSTVQSSVPPIVNQTTIGECGPGEDPRTTLCFDPDLP